MKKRHFGSLFLLFVVLLVIELQKDERAGRTAEPPRSDVAAIPGDGWS